jgi:hypothetical protein
LLLGRTLGDVIADQATRHPRSRRVDSCALLATDLTTSSSYQTVAIADALRHPTSCRDVGQHRQDTDRATSPRPSRAVPQRGDTLEHSIQLIKDAGLDPDAVGEQLGRARSCQC